MHVLGAPRAWAWQIPISADVTSIGVVCEGQAGLARDETGERFFARQIAEHPLLAARMAKAQPFNGGLQVEGAQSYFGERLAGPGWIALGDAAQFVDPVFSSGVSVAAESARLAARALTDALADPTHAAELFAEYDQTVRRGGEVWRELILLFYRMPPLFLGLLEDPARARACSRCCRVASTSRATGYARGAAGSRAGAGARVSRALNGSRGYASSCRGVHRSSQRGRWRRSPTPCSTFSGTLQLTGLEGYEKDWKFQTLAFCYARLPVALLFLTMCLIADWIVSRRA